MKQLLVILSVLISLSAIGQLRIGPLGDAMPLGNYPGFRLANMQTGSYPVQTITQRNAIAYKIPYMTVYVGDSSKSYRLGSDLTTWTEIITSGGTLQSVLTTGNTSTLPIFVNTTTSERNVNAGNSSVFRDSCQFWGNSITAGTGTTNNIYRYSTVTAKGLMAYEINMAISGTTMQANGNHSMVERARNNEIPVNGNYRYVFLAYGVNDANIPVGDSLGFIAAYNEVIDSFVLSTRAHYTLSQLKLLTPSFITTNTARALMFANCTKKIAADRGVQVIDQYAALLNAYNTQPQILNDNLHPSNLGARILAENILYNLQSDVKGIVSKGYFYADSTAVFKGGINDISSLAGSYAFGTVSTAKLTPKLKANFANNILTGLYVKPDFDTSSLSGVAQNAAEFYGNVALNGGKVYGIGNKAFVLNQGDVIASAVNANAQSTIQLVHPATGKFTFTNNYSGGGYEFYTSNLVAGGSSLALNIGASRDLTYYGNIVKSGASLPATNSTGDIILGLDNAIGAGGSTSSARIIAFTSAGNQEFKMSYPTGNFNFFVANGVAGTQSNAFSIGFDKKVTYYGTLTATGAQTPATVNAGDILINFGNKISVGSGNNEGSITPYTATGKTEIRNAYVTGSIDNYVSGGATGSQTLATSTLNNKDFKYYGNLIANGAATPSILNAGDLILKNDGAIVAGSSPNMGRFQPFTGGGNSEFHNYYSTGNFTFFVTNGVNGSQYRSFNINQLGTLSDSLYGAGSKTASALSKTASGYLTGFSTDGTFIEVPASQYRLTSDTATSPASTATIGQVQKRIDSLAATKLSIKKILPDADYTITSSDNTIILFEPATTARTLTLPAASTMANKEIKIVCRTTTTGRWILSGAFVQRATTGTIASTPAENFTNSGLTTGTTYVLVSDGIKWYDIND